MWATRCPARPNESSLESSGQTKVANIVTTLTLILIITTQIRLAVAISTSSNEFLTPQLFKA